MTDKTPGDRLRGPAEAVLTAATAAEMLFGLAQPFVPPSTTAPPTRDQVVAAALADDVALAADAIEAENEAQRSAGDDLAEAIRLEGLESAEHRPPPEVDDPPFELVEADLGEPGDAAPDLFGGEGFGL